MLEFSVGEKIEYECALGGINPRWDYTISSPIDLGATNVWRQGIITEVGHNYVHIQYDVHGVKMYWVFSDLTAAHLRKFNYPCECGSLAVYGDNAPHSHWCPASKHTLEKNSETAFPPS